MGGPLLFCGHAGFRGLLLRKSSLKAELQRERVLDPYLAEFIGTAILLLLGTGVVANVLLKQTKGHDSGLIIITAGWGFSVVAAVACVGDISGAHLNPAVTIGLACAGEFDSSLVPGYVIAQLAGAMTGALIAWIFYCLLYTSDAADDA